MFVKKNKLIILLIIIFMTPLTYGKNFECYFSKIRFLYFGKYQISKNYFCTNKDRTILVSKSCIKKKCNAFKHKINVKQESLHSEIGTPGFKLCRKLKGEPQIVEFLVGKKWYKLDRCSFHIDGSYVDTGILWVHYMK